MSDLADLIQGASVIAKIVALFVPGAGLMAEGLSLAEGIVAPAESLVTAAKTAFATFHTDPVAGFLQAQSVVAHAETTMEFVPATRSWRMKAA